jgi:hypothetical protein
VTVAVTVGKYLLRGVGAVAEWVGENARHPLTLLEEEFADVFEDDVAESLSVVVPLAVALYASVSLPEGATLRLLGVWAVVFGLLATRKAPRRTEDAEKDMLLVDARRKYLEGDITHSEYERRLEVLLDGEARRIRETVEAVHDVGPELSSAIALRFDSVAALEQADREDLEAIHGVGPSTAEAILAYVRDEDDVAPFAGTDHVDETDESEDEVEIGAVGEHERAESGAVDRAASEQEHAQVAGRGDRPDLDLAEVLAARELLDRAMDPESDVSVEDLEEVPRAALRGGETAQ